MNAEVLAVRYLGIALIFLIVGIVLCFLASLGYNTYIRFQDKHKKIEVQATDSKSNNKWDKPSGFSLFLYNNIIIHLCQ